MARPSKFAHVVYRTRRFDEMVDWYARVFEADVRYEDPVLAFLTYDDEVLLHQCVRIDLHADRSGVPEHVLLRRPEGAGMPIPAEHGV